MFTLLRYRSTGCAGPGQSHDNPLGRGGPTLHQWFYPTRTLQQTLFGKDGSTGTDDSWREWWGENPPYHVPVFVLTHHARQPLQMEGGTVFHFVSDPIETVLERAKDAAKGRDVRLGGGEHLFAGLDVPGLGYEVTRHVASEAATHVVLSKR